MHLGDIKSDGGFHGLSHHGTSSTRASRAWRRSAARCAAACLLALGGVAGCSSLADTGPKGFFAPQELTSRRHQPLPVKILSSLSVGYDVEEQEFSTATQVEPDDLKAERTDYVIGKNDVLIVQIVDLAGIGVESVRQVRVTESGNITLPYLNLVKAAGMTEAQLQASIVEAYRKAGLIPNAQVSVSVTDARQRVFSIRGAVNRAGQYAILNTDFRVLDAIVLAGDVQQGNLEYLYIIRPKADNAATQPAVAPASTEPAIPAVPTSRPDPFAVPSSAAPSPVQYATAAAQSIQSHAGDTPATTQAAKPDMPGDLRTVDEERPSAPFITGTGKNPTTWTTTPAATATTVGPNDSTPEHPMVHEPAETGAELHKGASPMGGGAVAEGDSRAFEFNAPLPTGESRIIRIPLQKLLDGDLRYNAVVRPNDMLMIPVPKIARYFVGGHVSRTGVYDMTNQQITLKQAIISAGMLDDLAIPQRTDLIRRIGSDREVFVRVNLEKVFDGSQSDIFLKPNDVIQVGTNAAAPFLSAFRNAFRITYGFGFLYDRNYATYTNSKGIQNGG